MGFRMIQPTLPFAGDVIIVGRALRLPLSSAFVGRAAGMTTRQDRVCAPNPRIFFLELPRGGVGGVRQVVQRLEELRTLT